ncbi:uncharacterized protein LOC107861756 [Capsicum annuum]|uniref:uncharacterized protein LOC107861756 n=1 Tax=Capsicum annuum TaxID=4072 RepID=UPI001FB182C3|nr:uncharacterized protein LOC107861756 [Capsicum annuum]
MIKGPSMRRPQVFGEAQEGLYLIKSNAKESFSSFSKTTCRKIVTNPSSSSVSVSHEDSIVSSPICTNATSNVRLWHIRLGHLPFSSMKNVSFLFFPCTFECFCDICPKARQSRSSFRISQISTTSIFDLIHIILGDLQSRYFNGYRYFLTIVDDYSRGTWTYLLRTKSNVFPVLQCFLNMVERQFNIKVNTIRSDNALELGKSLIATNYFNSQGIVHQTSCVASPQQNGVVERKHRHLLETARALLFQSQVSLRYWGKCILTATFLINRMPSRVLHGKTPYHRLFGKAPNYSSLRCFGCLCYASTLSHGRGKFEPRAQACVFLGYPINQKGFKLLELNTQKIIVTRDVQFYENIFLFTKNPISPPPIFSVPDHESVSFIDDTLLFNTNSTNHTFPFSDTLQASDSSHSQSTPPSPPENLPAFSTPFRRSDRTNKGVRPVHLQEYFCNNIFFSPVTEFCFASSVAPNSISFAGLSLSNQLILESVSTIKEPTSYH